MANKKKNTAVQKGNSPRLNSDEILEQIYDGVMVLDQNGSFQYLNKNAELFLNRPAEDLTGKVIWEEFPEMGDMRFKKTYDSAREKMQQESVKNYYPPLEKWFEFRFFPKRKKTIIFFRDVTDSKKQESDLNKTSGVIENYFYNSGIMVWEEDFSEAKSCLQQVLAQGVKDLKNYLLDHPEKMLEVTSKIRVKTVNRASLDFYGVENLAQLNTVLADWFIPGSWPVFADELAHLMSGGLSYQNEIRVKSPSGKYFDLLFNVSVPPENVKTLERVLVSFVDITRMRRMEHDMDLLQSRMDAAIRIGEIGYWDWDIKNDVVFWSDRMYEIYNVDRNTKLQYDTVIIRVHPDDRELHNKLVEKRLQDKDNSPFEYRVLWPDGTVKFVLVQMEVLDNENGEAVQFRGTVIDITEKKKAEQILKQSEEKYRTLIERVSDAFVALDKNWNYTYVNKLAGEIFGRDPESLIGKNIWTEFPEGVGQPFYKAYFKAMETQTYQALEEYYPPWDKYFENHIYPSPEGLSIYFKDITARTKTEKKLKESEEKYRNLIENASDPIIVYSAAGQIIDCNSMACEISGYDKKSMMQMNITDLIFKEDLETKPMLFNSISENTSIITERRLRHKEGFAVDLEINTRLMLDGNIMSVARNLKERKKAEAEKQMLLHRNRQILNTMLDGYILADSSGKILEVNPAYCNMTGYTQEELQHMDLKDIEASFSEEQIKQRIRDMMEEKSVRFETRHKCKDGTMIDLEVSISLLMSESEPLVAALLRDITERKKILEKIHISNEQLRRLASHLLSVREEERQRIGREIHDDLGQQLTAIKMDVAWIEKKMPGDAAVLKEKLKNIISLLDTSNRSVRRILNELKPSILDEYGLMDALIWHGKQFTANTGIPVNVKRFEKEVGLPEEISTCIYRIFQESLTNISKYAQASKVDVELIYNRNHITVHVKDDGIGFDIKSVESKNTFGLIGMKERVRALNGQFKLESKPGSGTMISLHLPVERNTVS